MQSKEYLETVVIPGFGAKALMHFDIRCCVVYHFKCIFYGCREGWVCVCVVYSHVPVVDNITGIEVIVSSLLSDPVVLAAVVVAVGG